MNLTTNQRIWTTMITFLLAIVCPTFAASTIYVDADAPGANDGSSWNDAYNFLQDALAAALGGDEIRVAQGIYKPDQGAAVIPGDRDATFQLINGVILKGVFAGFGHPNPNERDFEVYKTILSGDLAGNDVEVSDPYDLLTETTRNENSYHVVTAGGTDETAVIDGFIITGGNANNSSTDSTRRGGGMYCGNIGSPTVINCTFNANSAESYGGGIDNNGSPTLTNCIFVQNSTNSMGGGIYNTSGKPTLTNCAFTGNFSRYGGGMYSYLGSPKLNCCTFTKNSVIERGGGFVSTTEAANPILTNCTFSMNSAKTNGGGVYNVLSSPTFINCSFITNSAAHNGGGMYNASQSNTKLFNCVFSGNVAVSGAGIYNRYSNPNLTNCTLSGNSAQQQGAGMYNFSTSTVLTNCILWANYDFSGIAESAQIYSERGSPSVNYCCIQDWTGSLGGVGNIGENPMFIDADGTDNIFGTDDDNLRLLAGSPCLDAGDNSAIPSSVVTDLDGNPRIADTVVDMGAYEGPRQGFLLSTRSVSVPETETATFTVALAMDPTGTIEATVAVESGDHDITVDSGDSLVFDSSNYAIPQTVTLVAAKDDDYLFGTTVIRIQAAGLHPAEINARETDFDAPAVLYVDIDAAGANNGLSWADAFNYLQDALSAVQKCPPVQQVRVAQGIYKPDRGAEITPKDRTAAFQLINGVSIEGGYAGSGEPAPDSRDFIQYKTTLSGDLNADDGPAIANNTENSYHVVTGSKTDATAVINGFTITAGNANGSPQQDYDNGGGMYNEYLSSPTVTNCTFSCNAADSQGGAMYTAYGVLRLTNCKFIANSAGSLGGAVVGDGTITDCTFSANSADVGGGLAGSGTITNCKFTDNHAANEGGGMLNFYIIDSILINCRFSGNSAGRWGGGMVNIEDAGATLLNCIFDRNTACYGGGICNYSFNENLKLINCTLTDNSAIENAGGIFNDASTIKLTNSIIWANSDSSSQDFYAQIYHDRDGSAIFKYCCIQGWTPYYGSDDTIASDPCFVNPQNGDYHLRRASLCINAGDPDYVAGPDETDFDGKPRIIGGRIDMGAYEYSPTITAEARIVPHTINLASKGNWITSYIWLPDEYDVADIESNSIFLEDEIKPEQFLLNEDQQLAIATFDRGKVQAILDVGEIELKITGQLLDGTVFEAADTIKVINKAGK